MYEAGTNINSRKTTFNSPKLSKKKKKSSVDILKVEDDDDMNGRKGPVIALDQKRRVRRVRAGQPEEVEAPSVGEMLVISMENPSSIFS